MRDFVRDFTSTFRKVYKGEREVYGEGGRKMKVFVLEVGRPVRADVEREFGHIDEIVSVPRAISELEIPRIAAEAYHKIMKLASGGEEVAVVLSGPLGLAFELGQAIGLAHAKVIVYQFSQGRYVRVPPLTREHLFLAQGVR